MSSVLVRGARTDGAGLRKVTRFQSDRIPTINDDSYDDAEVGTVWEVLDADNKIIALYTCTDATAGAAVWQNLSEKDPIGHRIAFVEETVTFNGGATYDLVNTIPAGAIPILSKTNYDVAVILGTAVKLALGKSGTITGMGLTGTAVTKNHKETLNSGALVGVPLASALTLRITAAATDGTAAGTATSGVVRVRTYFHIFDDLADAA